MKPRSPRIVSLTRALMCLTLLIGAALGLFSNGASAQNGDIDPPARVARLADVIGSVWLYHPDSGDWIQAERNLPLTSGDTLATDPGARAELQVGSATLRVDSGSEIQVVVLDDNRLSLQLRAGALALRVRNEAETGPVDVTTDEGRFSVLAAGRYRFDRGTGSSFVGVDTGQIRYEYDRSALTVEAGQRAEFWIDANGAAQYGLGAGVYDAFTTWNNERDRATDSGVAARYVSPEMPGVADLDRYGSWEQSPDYGAVWIPRGVSAGWAPYSAGHWVSVRPWGWTWVDDAPWGFAPFHYGRWVNLRNRWCWTPGVREPRPVYAPALVGWVGGPRGGVSVGVGPAVGWFPLAPREVYVPSYRSSPTYARNINITHVRNINSINVVIGNPLAPRDFENRRFPRAITVVPESVFAGRRPVAPAASQFRDAPWAREFAQRGGPAPVLTAPPVASPNAPPRQPETRPARPAPGFVGDRGMGLGRPPRERDGVRPDASPPTAGNNAEPRPSMRDERDRSGGPDRVLAPTTTGNPPSTLPPFTPAIEPSRVRPLPIRPFNPADRAGPSAAPQPAPAVQPTPLQRPPPAAGVQEPERVRPLPMTRGGERRGDDGRADDRRNDDRRGDDRRGDDRRGDDRRGDDRRPSMRTESPLPAVPQAARPAPTAEPAAPQIRPVEAPRPVERVAPTPLVERPQPRRQEPAAPARPEVVAPRPAEPQAQRPAPAAVNRPPEAQRPAAPAAEAPRAAIPERRGDPNANR